MLIGNRKKARQNLRIGDVNIKRQILKYIGIFFKSVEIAKTETRTGMGENSFQNLNKVVNKSSFFRDNENTLLLYNIHPHV